MKADMPEFDGYFVGIDSRVVKEVEFYAVFACFLFGRHRV